MRYQIPTLVYQENNCVRNHAKELASYGKHALIITGHSSSKKNGSLKDVCDSLEEYNVSYTIFDEVEENPSVETCVKAAELGMNNNVDFVIGIGGGSPLDASKAIALLIGNKSLDGKMFYEPTLAKNKPVPVVSVPTTAGTGSEVTPYSILTIHSQKTKRGIMHFIFPKLALCDPHYLSFVPFQVLKNTAIDALAHLIESYLNSSATDYSRMFSEQGLKIWGRFKDNLSDNTLTEEDFHYVMEASTIAGMAIAHTGTSLPHGLSYPITYETGLAHGAACGLFLPGYLFFCMKNEAMANIGKKSESASDMTDTEHIFSFLGVKSLEEFARMMYMLLDDIPVAEELWQRDIDALLSNPAKTKHCPYPLTREDVENFI